MLGNEEGKLFMVKVVSVPEFIFVVCSSGFFPCKFDRCLDSDHFKDCQDYVVLC